MLIGGNGFVVLVQVAVEHSPLQRCLAGKAAVGVVLQQLLVRRYRRTLVVQLQLRTRRLVETVIGIVRLRIARHEGAHRVDLVVVLVLQALRIPALERGIIRPRGVLVHHLPVVGNGRGEIARVEIAVAYAVERIGVGRIVLVGIVDIAQKHRLRLGVIFLRKIRIAAQVVGLQVVARSAHIALRHILVEVADTSLVVVQPVVGFRTPVVCLGGVLRRLGIVVNHLRHAHACLLHLVLQKSVHTQLVAQILLGLQHLGRRVIYRVQYRQRRCIVARPHKRIAQQRIDLVFVFTVRKLGQKLGERTHALAQSRGRVVGAERIVVEGFLAHHGGQTVSSSRLV